jgi:hypothetical protein
MCTVDLKQPDSVEPGIRKPGSGRLRGPSHLAVAKAWRANRRYADKILKARPDVAE